MKIAVTGVHGSGKTTLARRMEYIAYRGGWSVRVVDEVARDCPLDLGSTGGQRWIWKEQYRREIDAMKEGRDVIICDRTLMDNLVYLRYIIENVDGGRIARELMGFFYGVTQIWMETYDRIIRLPLNEEYIMNADDDVRPKDLKYARAIDLIFDEMVDPYITEKR